MSVKLLLFVYKGPHLLCLPGFLGNHIKSTLTMQYPLGLCFSWLSHNLVAFYGFLNYCSFLSLCGSSTAHVHAS